MEKLNIKIGTHLPVIVGLHLLHVIYNTYHKLHIEHFIPNSKLLYPGLSSSQISTVVAIHKELLPPVKEWLTESVYTTGGDSLSQLTVEAHVDLIEFLNIKLNTNI